MSRSLPAIDAVGTCSGRMSDNGIRRGRGIVWKWVDGKILEEGIVRRGTHSVGLWISRATEASDEGPNAISSCIRGKSSHGSRAIGVESACKQQVIGEGSGFAGFEQVRRERCGGGYVEGSGNPFVGVRETEMPRNAGTQRARGLLATT